MSAKVQMTRQREAVLAVIQQAEKHLTAQEIYDRVRQQLPGIAYGTVYNALSYLQEVGLVQVVNVGSGPALYDRRLGRHDHVVCRGCGRVLDCLVPGLEQALEQLARETSFQIFHAHVLVEGVCPECQVRHTTR
ncbi:MAG: transcriptional repressor [Anaerolineae bacterium]|nr:transcriptional repressor [Anaerolineae bacterium]MDW8098728.1 transcriptional repressor [Anaerolineae bacterium]